MALLAHLYSRITGSQEDVATLSLQYIISSSPQLNAAFNKLMSSALVTEIEDDTTYSCQSVGENSERPDMSGVDSQGRETILCEMKFYAGLTSNQPNTYLDRLIKACLYKREQSAEGCQYECGEKNYGQQQAYRCFLS